MSLSILAAVSLAAQDAAKPGSPPPITFLVTALFAVAIFFLGFDLVRRIRRSQFKAEINRDLETELAQRRVAEPMGPESAASVASGGVAAPATEAGPEDAGAPGTPGALGSSGTGEGDATDDERA